MTDDTQIRKALQDVIDGPNSQLQRAKNYAIYALGAELTGEGLVTQLLWLIGNLGSWRGETAREARKVIRDYIAERRN